LEMMVVSAITIIIGDMEILHYSRIKWLKMEGHLRQATWMSEEKYRNKPKPGRGRNFLRNPLFLVTQTEEGGKR
jgi:hypothetical protein